MRLIDADELWKTFTSADKDDVYDLVDVREMLNSLPIIEPNLVINPEEVAEGRVIEIGEDIVVMHHKDYYDLLCEQFKVEPFEDAVRVYEYLKEKLGDEIVSDQKEFEAWFERMVWHVKRCDELGRMVCEDAISREGALKFIDEQYDDARFVSEYVAGCNSMNETIRNFIEDAPTVAPSRPSGEWILKEQRILDFRFRADIIKCSKCDNEEYRTSWRIMNFCPNCGADMRGADNE